MFRNILTSRKPEYLADQLAANPSQATRSGTTIAPTTGSLNLKRSSFMYRGIKLFNGLPESIRGITNMSSFKKQSEDWVRVKP